MHWPLCLSHLVVKNIDGRMEEERRRNVEWDNPIIPDIHKLCRKKQAGIHSNKWTSPERKCKIKFELIFYRNFPVFRFRRCDVNSMSFFSSFFTGKFIFLTLNVKLILREWLLRWKLRLQYSSLLFLFLVAFNHDFSENFPGPCTTQRFLFTNFLSPHRQQQWQQKKLLTFSRAN